MLSATTHTIGWAADRPTRTLDTYRDVLVQLWLLDQCRHSR